MSKKFYRDIKIIKFCKQCGVAYKPARWSFFAMLGLCWVCRRPYYQRWYRDSWLPYFNRQTPERQEEIKAQKIAAWKVWVKRNLKKRQRQALESYHRHKDEHRGRKHRKVVK